MAKPHVRVDQPAALNPSPPLARTQSPAPRTVLAAKVVDLALITYTDERNVQRTQLGIVGDNHVHLIDPRLFGMSKEPAPQGIASSWLCDQVLELLGKKE